MAGKQRPSSISSRLQLALAILNGSAEPAREKKRAKPARDIALVVDDDNGGGTVPPAADGGAPAFAGVANTLPRNRPGRHRRPID